TKSGGRMACRSIFCTLAVRARETRRADPRIALVLRKIDVIEVMGEERRADEVVDRRHRLGRCACQRLAGQQHEPIRMLPAIGARSASTLSIPVICTRVTSVVISE